MSVLGQKQTMLRQRYMSAILPKTDIERRMSANNLASQALLEKKNPGA
jgi:hypothetical protein